MKEYKDDFTFDGCKRCGKCCENGVVVFEDEIEQVLLKLLEISKKSNRKVQILLSGFDREKFAYLLSGDNKKIIITDDPEEISQIQYRQLFTEARKRDIQLELTTKKEVYGEIEDTTILGKLDYCLSNYKKTCLLKESRPRDCRYYPIGLLNMPKSDKLLTPVLWENCQGIKVDQEKGFFQDVIDEIVEDVTIFGFNINQAVQLVHKNEIPKEIIERSIAIRSQLYKALEFIRRS